VLDACAGAGGKTLHLGALMRGRGDLFAFDPDARRLERLRRRARRAALHNVRVVATDNDFTGFREHHLGALDAVLVDAPCSGLGTLRRSPDIKLRVSPGLVDEMTAKQAAILDGVAGLVRQGGRLVYATCSILAAENAAIVDGFLARHSDYDVVPVTNVLAEYRGVDDLSALRARLGESPFLQLAPHTHNTDAFFGAVLRRTRAD
jgi:16S rRNA (cytosine967-C5)-methyltransferase